MNNDILLSKNKVVFFYKFLNNMLHSSNCIPPLRDPISNDIISTYINKANNNI